MARADIVLNLLKTGVNGDLTLFKRTAKALMVDEQSKNHFVLAKQIEDILKESEGESTDTPSSVYKQKPLKDALYETIPNRQISDLVLPKLANDQVHELIEEHHRRDLLRTYNLEPKHKLLFYGPPGNGKTSLAEAIAQSLAVPFFTLHYEDVVQSYLGESAKKLDLVFEYAANKRCVLFLDEFEAISKERDDINESGEIKRLVSSLLTQIDRLPSHVVVIAATNHTSMIDKAFWRRFQMHVELGKPNQSMIKDWIATYQNNSNQDLHYEPALLAKELRGLSFSEVESFALDVTRRYVLSQPSSSSSVKGIVDKKILEWKNRLTS